jgi:hypothetical protein
MAYIAAVSKQALFEANNRLLNNYQQKNWLPTAIRPAGSDWTRISISAVFGRVEPDFRL